jgi:hypothetical protein
MTDIRINELSNGICDLFREVLNKYTYEDKKWLSFEYNDKDGILSLYQDGKLLSEVKVKIFHFLVPGVIGKINVVSPGAYYTNLYLQYGLEDEVKEYRANLIKKLLELLDCSRKNPGLLFGMLLAKQSCEAA